MEIQNRHKAGNNQLRAQRGRDEEGDMFSHFKVLTHLVWHCIEKVPRCCSKRNHHGVDGPFLDRSPFSEKMESQL